ncbi:MAG: hypothetical protein ACLQGP_33575 [Isosphaeraceae bacterium]
MFSKKLGIAAVVLVGLGASGMGWALGQVPGDARGTQPAAPRRDVARLSPAADVPRLSPVADVLYKYVKRLRPGEFKWERIPWLEDLPEAVRQARAENRPILIWIASDPPLERC